MDVSMIRLDKFLADMSIGTRADVKKYIRQGKVQINNVVIKKPETKLDITHDKVCLDGELIEYKTYEYYMLNKPSGVVSATKDAKDKTVLDLISDNKRKDLFPVGRLDKDTEGLILLTNNGDLAHKLLAPKNHVNKVYLAKIDGTVTEKDVELFAEGLSIGGGDVAKPSKLEILSSGSISEIRLTIQEGQFHQVKRMFEAVGKKVIYLKRISIGDLKLDEKLALGEYRSLTDEEIENLC